MDDGDTNCGWFIWDNPQRTGKETGRLGNKRTSKNHPDYSNIKIGQNTLKEFWKLEESYCHSSSSGKPSANTSVKNSQKNKEW